MALRIRRRKARRQHSHRPLRAGDRTMTFVADAEHEAEGVELPSVDEVETALETAPDEIDWD